MSDLVPNTLRSAGRIEAADIAGLFPMEVSACVATDAMYDGALFEAEWAAVAKARAARRREFAAGRASARHALAGLGGPAAILPMGHGRAPVWPAGFVGSITHTDDLCAAVAARTRDALSLGLDAEAAGPLAEGIERLVCCQEDYPSCMGEPDLKEVAWPKVVFSIKEAFYKCQYPLTRRFLDFDAAVVSFAPGQGPQGGAFSVGPRPQAGALAPWPRCSGRWRINSELVLASVWVQGPDEGAGD